MSFKSVGCRLGHHAARQLEVIDYQEEDMKDHTIVIALIIAVALIISAAVLSSGLKSYGHSIEKAGASIRSGLAASDEPDVPGEIRLHLGEIKIGNAGGAGEAFKIETSAK